MRISLILVLALFSFFIHAQESDKSSDQSRIIEINNDNGELYISFKNNVITKFIVNDVPVSKDRYNDYQAIIDDFTQETEQPIPPTPPAVIEHNENKSETLRSMITAYLLEKEVISSLDKYKIHLKRKLLKVNGDKVSNEIHNECLNIFDELHGHRLNFESKVVFKKSKNNSSSSVSIVD